MAFSSKKGWRAAMDIMRLRRLYLDEVNDPALRPKPRPPKPPRRERRRPSKPR